MAFSSSCKRRDRTPSPLKVRTPLVLHKASLMRSLGALLFPYETPGTLLVCSSLGCLPVVQLLCSWMFALYFLIPHCMTRCLRPVCPSQPLWSYLGCVVRPKDSRALAFSGIPTQFFLLGFFWLTDFGRLGLFFALWNLKHFLFMGLWIPILWTSHPFLLSFFLFSLQDNLMCYFSLGLGLWLILNLNTNKTTKSDQGLQQANWVQDWKTGMKTSHNND